MRRSLVTVVLAMLLALLVACTGSGSDSGGDEGGAGGGVADRAPGAPEDPAGAPGEPNEADPDRQVVTTASASLAVEDPSESAQEVSELVEDVGGRVDERSEQAMSGDAGVEGVFADLVVRVPSDELTGVLADLKKLGDVENISVSDSDVTATAVDLDARISALQGSVARLQALMDSAGSTEDLLAAERALSERQEKLESLQSQRSMLADQVELSTLSVHLAPKGVAPAGGPDGFLEGLGTGWRALVEAVGALTVALGVVLPWLVVAGLVTAVVLTTVRLRRRAAVAVPASPAPPQE